MRILKIRTLEDWEVKTLVNIEVLESVQIERHRTGKDTHEIDDKIKDKYQILLGIRKALNYEKVRHSANVPDDEKANLAEING